MEYEFTLKYDVGDEHPDKVLEALESAGCVDALVGVGKPGRVALLFMREATSAMGAFETALAGVKAALPDARFAGAVLSEEFAREARLKYGGSDVELGENPFSYGSEDELERLKMGFHEKLSGMSAQETLVPIESLKTL